MKFHPEDKKIKDIFGSSNIYRIPNFQRDYSWETENFNDFLNDLLGASNARFNKDSHTLEINSIEELEDYFFGTFLVVGDYSNSKDPLIVVDGQQRLTTMTLFLAAIRSIIEEVKKEKKLNYEHEFEEALVVNIKKNGKSEKQARVINERLTPILPVNILDINNHYTNGAIHHAENDSQKLILETYQWFKTQLSRTELAKRLANCKLKQTDTNKINQIPDIEYLNFIDNLGSQLLHSTVIIIYSADEQSANIMYRNFNFRGIPLSGPDLMKNEIFELLDDETGSVKKSWGVVEQNVYINESNSLSTFFIHYFSSKYKQASKKELFPIFLKNIDADLSSYSSFLNNLVKESTYYRVIATPNENDELFGVKNYFLQNDHQTIKRQLQILNDLEVTQVRTFLLGLFFAMDNKIISSSQFKKLIKNILLFQSLLVMTSSPANTIRGIYSKYARKFRDTDKKPNTMQPIITDFLKELAAKLPSKQLVLKSNLSYDHSIKSKDMTPVQKKHRVLIKLILIILSENHQNNSNQNKGNDSFKFISDASLEHIIDQSTKALKNKFSLGNLLLLEKSKHRNDIEKNEMYSNSEILMTKSFSEKVENFVSDKDIANRNKDLLSTYFDYVSQRLK